MEETLNDPNRLRNKLLEQMNLYMKLNQDCRVFILELLIARQEIRYLRAENYVLRNAQRSDN